MPSALSRADSPGRVTVATVQQNTEDGERCDTPVVPCESDPEQPLCKFADQIKIYEMAAEEATGPVYARHLGYRMYRGEAFAMQIDAHVLFVNHWDTDLLLQWESTGNEMAVLSTYLTDLQGSLDAEGNSKRNTRPIMCNSAFEGSMPARYLRHGAQPEEAPVVHGSPMMQPFWAAGMSFARGHFIHRVPYDCCLPMVFMGEEISIGIRGWTWGYDMYTLESSVVFHEYAQKSGRRRGVHMFWENHNHGSGQDALKRLTAIIGMAPDVADYDRTEEDKYGLGKARSVDEFYRIFLVDVEHRSSQQLCKFVKTGVMHRDFTALMRPDKKGVDYSKLADYDTAAAIRRELEANHFPLARKGLLKAIQMNDKGWLTNALEQAKRSELRSVDPELVGRAELALKALKNA